MTLSRTDIAGLIPHGGAMCLLESVQQWDEESLVCTATGHGDPRHPLRGETMLQAVCGIEYAAQAIAVHAALGSHGEGARPTGKEPVSAGSGRVGEIVPGAGGCERSLPPAQGLLAAVRDVSLSVERLDDIPGPLTIRIDKLMAHDTGVVYRFSISAEDRELLQGRLSVVRPVEGRADKAVEI